LKNDTEKKNKKKKQQQQRHAYEKEMTSIPSM
jgi:hypothetical protein